MPAHVLDGLDPEQRLVAEALTGPVVVLAGAGTGKTRAITHRIAHAVQTGTHAAGNGLAVTFTNRAAGEMRQRLAGLGVPAVSVRTFHAAALSQLRYFWPTAVGGQFPDLVSSKAALVGQACREIGLPSSRPLVRDLATEIEWAGSTMVSAGDYATAAAAAGRLPVGSGDTLIELPGIARVISAYQDAKSQAGAIDFEDVLLAMIALIGDRPDIADAIRAQYRWFTVDEYQDITPAQDRLLSAWLGDRDDVCVVGDASQTIYSFAGASPDALGQFARRWPNATEVRLDRCYRCTPEIVAVANSVIGGAAGGPRDRVDGSGRLGGEVGEGPAAGPGPGGGVATAVWLRSQRPSGVAPEIVACADDAEEAATVAARVADLVSSGFSHRDIAILMRTNAASEPIEVAFAEAGIPYVMRGAERFFDRPEVREAVVRMRGHAVAGGGRRRGDPAKGVVGPRAGRVEQGGPELPGAVQAELTLPGPTGSRAVGAAQPADAANGLVEQTHAVLAGMGWLSTGPASGGATRERWESLAAVLALAEEVAASGRSTMAELVEEFERRAQLSHAPTADGVTVTTLHSAKGLEWPVVFIVGAAEGTLPIVYADTPERIEEERRLFYVGVTRAQDRLVVTWAMTRPGSGRHRQASRFLSSMRTRGAAPGEEGSASGLVRRGRSAAAKEASGRRPPGRCRVCGAGLVTGRERTLGRCLKCPGATDEGLAARLREWRDAEAHGRGLPASIVLTDETLAAVEERRPATDDDLRDIPGFRPDKIAAYGDQVLAIVAGSGDPAGARPTVESGQGGDVIDVRGASDAHGDEPQAESAPPEDPAGA
jgi:DNA helicase-2/ATP-dependent DNA helicase PcrA